MRCCNTVSSCIIITTNRASFTYLFMTKMMMIRYVLVRLTMLVVLYGWFVAVVYCSKDSTDASFSSPTKRVSIAVSINKTFADATRKLRNRDNIAALRLLKESSRLSKLNGDVHLWSRAIFLRANIFQSLGAFHEQIRSLESMLDVGCSEERIQDRIRQANISKKIFNDAVVSHAIGHYGTAFDLLTELIEGVARQSPRLLFLRAECCFYSRNYVGMRNDVMRILREHDKYDAKSMSLLSRSFYADLGNVTAAVRTLRSCALVAPDFAPCSKYLKLYGAIERHLLDGAVAIASRNMSNAVHHYKSVLSLDNANLPRKLQIEVYHNLCISYTEMASQEENTTAHFGSFEAIDACSAALAAVGGDAIPSVESDSVSSDLVFEAIECRVRTGWAWIFLHHDVAKARYEVGYADSLLRRHHRGSSRDVDGALSAILNLRQKVKDKIREIEEMREEKENVAESDFYKILGLVRNATLSEIKKAYRMLAFLWHPDRHAQNLTARLEANEMFMLISKAYETLLDPHSRRMYDQGLDPEKTSSGSGSRQSRTHFTMEKDERDSGGWRTAWAKDEQTGRRWKVRVNNRGRAPSLECPAPHFCITRRFVAPPRAFARVVVRSVRSDSATISYVRPDIAGPNPTILFVIEGDVNMADRSCLAYSSAGIPVRGDRGRFDITGLEAGTRYRSLHFLACSTPSAASCDHLNLLECSLPVRLPPFTTEMPVLRGEVNTGTLDGGGWRLVRRLAIPANLSEVIEREFVFQNPPMGIGIVTSFATSQDAFPSVLIGSVEGQAKDMGVVNGSEIVRIDGVDVTQRTFEDIRPLLDQARWPLKIRVRLPSSTEVSWHPSNDSLVGTTVYGADTNDPLSDKSFSKSFEQSEFDQYLFSTGDGSRFAIVAREDFCALSEEIARKRRGSRYLAELSVRIELSNIRTVPYETRIVVSRTTAGSFLFLDETEDFDGSESPGYEYLYAERSWPARGDVRNYLIAHRGANVWVRKAPP